MGGPGPNTRRRRRNQILLWVGSAVVTLVLLVSLNGAASQWGVPVLAQRIAILLAVIGLLGLTWLQWRELDEVGRQMHTLAFYWSGLLVWTLALVVVGLSAAGGTAEGPLFPAYGSALMVIGLHGVAYLAFYGVLWLRNRLP